MRKPLCETHCISLQHTATHCNTLQYITYVKNALRGSLEGAFYRGDHFDLLEKRIFLYDSLGGELYVEAPMWKYVCHMYVTY